MGTRILPVRDANGDPYPLAGQGTQAAASLGLEVASTATATIAHAGASSSSTTATVTAAASLARTAAATRSITATITASATVGSATDISSLLTEGYPGSSYDPGGLVVPGYDQAYSVTIANSRFPSPTTSTPGVRITLPAPSTPNAEHWLTITYNITNGGRRLFHDMRTRWRIDGTVTEPNPTTGATTVLHYAWDTTEHVWYVDSYTGSPTIRQHGPDENPSGGIPLYFTPEARAHATFSTIKSTHLTALSGLPTSTSEALRDAGQLIDITSPESGFLFETMTTREIFDLAWDSNITGRYWDPTVNAYPTQAGWISGITMLHELGHAWDAYALVSQGFDYGIDPVSGCNVAYRTDYTYYPDGVTPEVIVDWTPTTLTILYFDEAGTQTDELSYVRAQSGALNEEAPVLALYNSVPDHGGNYYRSTISEWIAQSLMLMWAENLPGYTPGATSAAITVVGGSTVYEALRDYLISVNALPA
jgi:hypothetical protein